MRWATIRGLAHVTQTKIKCWLFFSYVVAFAAVAGGVAVLVACVNKHHNLAIGIVRTRLLVAWRRMHMSFDARYPEGPGRVACSVLSHSWYLVRRELRCSAG